MFNFALCAGAFGEYKKINTESKRIVDDLYREILLRPSDPDGLQYFASQLENDTMTIDEIKKILINSIEFQINP